MTGVTFNQYQNNNWMPQWQNNTSYANNNWCATNLWPNTNFGNTWTPFNTYGWGNKSASTSSSTNKTIEEIEKEKLQNNQKASEQIKQEYMLMNQSTTFAGTGLTKHDEKIIKDYNTKKQEYVEDLGTNLVMGVGMGVALPNLRNVTHPFSAAKSTFSKNSVTNQIFKDFVKTDLWKNEASAMQKAYELMQKAEVRANKSSWQGWFKRGYTQAEFDDLQKIMDTALKSGDKNKILEATAKLQNADSIKQGKFSQFFNWIKGKFGIAPSKAATVTDKVTNTKAITNGVKELANLTSTMTFKQALKSSVGGKTGIAFSLLNLASEWKYISAAFKEDSSTGFKQLGQSLAKAGASWGGYVLGDALGKWGGAKLGAMLGSAICPGLGTAIGAVAGVLCGTIGQWGLRKIVNWAVGDNVANKLITNQEIAEAQASPEAKGAFLQNFIAQAEADKNLDSDTLSVVNKIKRMQALAATESAKTNGTTGQQMQTLA